MNLDVVREGQRSIVDMVWAARGTRRSRWARWSIDWLLEDGLEALDPDACIEVRHGHM